MVATLDRQRILQSTPLELCQLLDQLGQQYRANAALPSEGTEDGEDLLEWMESIVDQFSWRLKQGTPFRSSLPEN
jgi:hypothetical protein